MAMVTNKELIYVLLYIIDNTLFHLCQNVVFLGRFKPVSTNVGMACDRIHGKNNHFFVGVESPLRNMKRSNKIHTHH